jgi:tRNA(Ile2) C34 agmatinyltransferase TiaS
MTGALLERPVSRGVQPTPDGGVTLEERLNLVLDAVRASGSAECPVCHARMMAAGEAAECGDCGSRLG